MNHRAPLYLSIVIALTGCGSSDTSTEPEVDTGTDGTAPSDTSTDETVTDSTPTDTGADTSTTDSPVDAPDTAPPPTGASVLEHHNGPTRAGMYVAPTLTKTAAAALKRDAAFSAKYTGPSYGQPLFLSGVAGKDVVFVATERNDVHAFDAATGALVWKVSLGTPVPRSKLPCGNIDPLGVTSTGIIDAGTGTLSLAAMTTPDGGTTKKHLIFALSVADGSVKSGWPVDVSAKATSGGVAFDSSVQHERGALALMGGTLYVPYGGHYGDCGTYHGWVVGVPTGTPATVTAWATTARGGGIWAPSGIASDGTALYVSTGNTFGATTWSGGEALVRLTAGPAFSGKTADYFAPTDWVALDSGDIDLGGSGALVVDVPGATPGKLVVGLGKSGKAYVADRTNLGGVGAGVATLKVASNMMINAPATYRTAKATYVVTNGAGVGCPGGSAGDLIALAISAASPPVVTVAWCAHENGMGSPMVTTTDGTANALVWGLGSEGSNRLTAFDGDTGAVVFGGGGAPEAMSLVRRYVTPIVAKGRVYVATDTELAAFTF
jgi:hypothetical protein